MTRCSNCDYWPASRRGRCDSCYRYWRRTGIERPLSLIWRAFYRARWRERYPWAS